MEKLTIRYESGDGEIAVESTYSQRELACDDLFWLWFVGVFDTIGLPSITKDLKENTNG